MIRERTGRCRKIQNQADQVVYMEKQKKTRSLTVILSLIVIVTIIIVFSVFVVVVRTTVVDLTENSYTNQLLNFNKTIEDELVRFYQTQVDNASFLAKNDIIKRAMVTGQYDIAKPLIKGFYDEKGIYEEVFLSTFESNSLIVASGSGRATGLRWGEIPVYRENARKAMQGEAHVSDVGKSPASGLIVILVTVPVKVGSNYVGIVGLPVEVGKFSKQLVEGITIGKTGYPYITDKSGLTFAHPEEKNIFKLNIKDYEWGRQMLDSPSGSVIHYMWEDREKLQTFVKNEKFGFISAATMYVDDYMGEIRAMDMYLFPLAAFLILGAAGVIFVFMRRRLRPLKDCEMVMASMADGDLSKRYTGEISNDEIGTIASALNNTLDQFERLISEVVVMAQNLGQAVQEISSGNENLSQRTSEQASSLEEIASTIEETTATIKQNAETATEANKIADTSSTLANEGGEVVDDAVEAINKINESGKKIGEIISMINDISFQTNLLALNAAVEAARAGESGRGFAVVAGEVRNLAQRSGNAAKEISELINESVNRVEKGTELVNKSGESLRDIIQSVQQVSQLVSEIAAASEEQRQGVDQINVAVADMDTMTQQNAALVEETASASEEMANQAQELVGMMERFVISGALQTQTFKEKYREVHVASARDDMKKGKAPAGKTGEKKEEHESTSSREDKPETDVKKSLVDDGFEEF